VSPTEILFLRLCTDGVAEGFVAAAFDKTVSIFSMFSILFCGGWGGMPKRENILFHLKSHYGCYMAYVKYIYSDGSYIYCMYEEHAVATLTRF